jgi:RNA polymerase sigma factor (sigma-70 family)
MIDPRPSLPHPRRNSQPVRNSAAVVRELVSSNRALVFLMMKRYRFKPSDVEDAMQEGMIGLHRAAECFDASRCKFSTHACWYIRGALSAFTKRRMRWYDREIAGSAMFALTDDGARMFDGMTDPAGRTFVDRGLVALHAKHTEPDFDEKIDDEEAHRRLRLRAALRHLDKRERVTMEMRSHGMTFRAIAEELSISRERVRQLEVRALEKLREYFGILDSARTFAKANAKGLR